MSRNVKRNTTSVTNRNARRDSDTSTASSFDLSDEGGYSAVEDITDSEDNDEEDVDAVEEENIRTEAVAQPLPSPPPRPPFYQKDDQQDQDDLDQSQDDDAVLGRETDCQLDIPLDPTFDLDDQRSWAGIMSDEQENQSCDFYNEATVFADDATVERHVRFDVPSSDSDSTETEDDHGDLFPDIFVSQNSLDPAFRREIEIDAEDDSSGSATFWDYSAHHEDDRDSDAEEIVRHMDDTESHNTNTNTTMTNTLDLDMDTDPIIFDDYQDLDGYETDGDTTEEDTPEPSVRQKVRRPSVAVSELSDSDAEPVKNQRGQPRLGRFKLDRSDKKPIAVLNPLTRKMMIFTPHHRRHQLDLSPEQFNLSWPTEERTSPLLCNSANMMLSAMFSTNTFGDFVNAQTMGPAEAFFPFPSQGTSLEGNSSSAEGDDDDAEMSLDISDFIKWNELGSSADEGDNNGDWQPSSTPLRPTTASSEVDVLSHLNPETVGAFRRNQINQQLILSSQATQDSLAFSGPYNYMALKGLKSDRFDTAGIPLTPIRRHKRQMSDIARSPLETVSTKRKASSEHVTEHKRHRTISEVNLLRI